MPDILGVDISQSLTLSINTLAIIFPDGGEVTYDKNEIQNELQGDLELFLNPSNAELVVNEIQAIQQTLNGLRLAISPYVDGRIGPGLPGLRDFDADFDEANAIIGNVVLISAEQTSISGGSDLDFLVGGSSAEILSGFGGNDVLIGGSGNDKLDGGSNNDRIIGGNDSDVIRGGSGDDTLFFDSDDSVVDGGTGRDFGYAVFSDAGVELDYQSSSLEVVVGSSFADTFEVTSIPKAVYFAGGYGNDTMKGAVASGQPVVFWGGEGADVLELEFVDGVTDSGRNVPSVLVAEVDGLTEANFHLFDLDMLGLGETFDWSVIDAVVLNPDQQDKVFVGGIELGVKYASYELIGYPYSEVGFPEEGGEGPGGPGGDLFGPEGQVVGSREMLLDSRSLTSNALTNDFGEPLEGSSYAVGDVVVDLSGRLLTVQVSAGMSIEMVSERLDGPGGTPNGEEVWKGQISLESADASYESETFFVEENYSAYANEYLWIDIDLPGTNQNRFVDDRGAFDIVYFASADEFETVDVLNVADIDESVWFVVGGGFSLEGLSSDGSISASMEGVEGVDHIAWAMGAMSDVETVTLDNGLEVETTTVNGVKTKVVVTDAGNAFAYASYTDTFDSDGSRATRSTTYDDGRDAFTTYVNGMSAASFILDAADEFVWSTVDRTFDENGLQSSQTNTYDDGRILEINYANGVRSTAVMTDVNNAYAWSSYTDTYDANGDLSLRTTFYDDGRVVETTGVGGVTSSSLITDIDDLFAWDTVERGYDANGMQVSQTNTYDDGRVLETAFLDGVQSSATMTDPANVYAWSSYTDSFDAEGNRVSRNTLYDDGRESVNTYADGVLASSFTTDVADQFIWNTVDKTYDANGVQTGQTTAYDNGRLLETLYVGGIRSTATMTDVDDVYAWASYVDTFDANGDLATRTMLFDDGREVFTDYMA